MYGEAHGEQHGGVGADVFLTFSVQVCISWLLPILVHHWLCNVDKSHVKVEREAFPDFHIGWAIWTM